MKLRSEELKYASGSANYTKEIAIGLAILNETIERIFLPRVSSSVGEKRSDEVDVKIEIKGEYDPRTV